MVNKDSGIDGPSISIDETVSASMLRPEISSVSAEGIDGTISDFQCIDPAIINERSTFLEVPTVSHKDCRRSSVLETFQHFAAGFQGSGRDHRFVKYSCVMSFNF
jgi:hypothetical protein